MLAELPNVGRLTRQHYAVIRDYFRRSRTLSEGAAYGLGRRIADDIARLLETPTAGSGGVDTFLATVLRAYEDRHRYFDGDLPETLPATSAGAGSEPYASEGR